MYEEWCEWKAGQGCRNCSSRHVQLHHAKLLLSPKTGLRLARRKGLNLWAVVPLCIDCHLGSEGVHSKREEEWFEERGIDVLREFATDLVRFLEERSGR